MKRLASLALLALALTGCMGPGKSGAQLLKPWTWTSHKEASSADRAEEKVDAATVKMDDAREDLLKAAQRETHRASLALVEAPESRPVSVATDATSNATAALDQALGPLSVADTQALRARVTALLSEVETVRIAAEQAQARDTAALIDAGRKLEAAERKLVERAQALSDAQAELRTAFDRENALANKLRGQRWFLIGTAIVGFVGYALVIYMRITSGSLLTKLVGGIQSWKKSPGVANSPEAQRLFADLEIKMDDWQKKLVRKIKVQTPP